MKDVFTEAIRAGSGLALLLAVFAASPAAALSELPVEEVPPAAAEAEEASPPPAVTGPIPLPDPVVPPGTTQAPRSDAQAQAQEEASPGDEPLPDVFYGEEGLPEPVRRMRRLIMEACLSGDIEQLRPLLGSGDLGTNLSFGGPSGDPVEFLRGLSGDDEGHEILAILYEVLDAGHAHVDPGTPQELYVWPYFFALPLEGLDARQRVELFKIVTAGDYEDMKLFGAYIFYRVGITPDGRWQFFVAGD